jgi:hypothetical protein
MMASLKRRIPGEGLQRRVRPRIEPEPESQSDVPDASNSDSDSNAPSEEDAVEADSASEISTDISGDEHDSVAVWIATLFKL